jgi:hypothetical protein
VENGVESRQSHEEVSNHLTDHTSLKLAPVNAPLTTCQLIRLINHNYNKVASITVNRSFLGQFLAILRGNYHFRTYFTRV